jgi:primosomal protein N' (replication factor Y)
VIQTYWPDHPAIAAVAAHDPQRFIRQELEERADLGYPPAGRLARVLLTGSDNAGVRLSASSVAEAARAGAPDGVTVLGPAPAAIARIKNAYRWHVLIKGPSESDLPALVGAALSRASIERDVAVAPDIDPLDLM